MIIKSYLIFPVEGGMADCVAALKRLPNCRIEPSTNRDLLILVTDSADEAAEKELEKQLDAIPYIQAVTLVSGLKDDQ